MHRHPAHITVSGTVSKRDDAARKGIMGKLPSSYTTNIPRVRGQLHEVPRRTYRLPSV